MKKFFLVLITCIFWVGLHAKESQQKSNPYFEQPPQFKVFTFYSANASNETRRRISIGLQKALDATDLPYSIDTMELNMLYHYDPIEWDAILDKGMNEIKHGKYHLILAAGDEACNVLTKKLSQIPESTNVIYSCVKQFDTNLKKIHRNTTAVIREQNPYENIKIGMDLLKDTKEIFILTSKKNWNTNDEKNLQEKVGNKVLLRTIYIDSDKPEALSEISRKLQEIPADAFLVSLDWDRYFINESARMEMWNWIKRQYKGPIFVRRYALVEYAVGGSISRLMTTGEITGKLAMQIYNGIDAEYINPVKVPEFLTFNYNEMQKFGIKKSDLPKGAEILNEPVYWYSNERLLEIVLAIITTLLTAISVMVVSFLYYNKKIKRGQSIYNSLPVRVAVYDREGNILFFHREHGVKTNLPDTKYKKISDIPWIKENQLLDAIVNVYDNGFPLVLDYDFFGEKRSATFARIDNSIFGKAAVISVSSDSSALQNAQEDAINLAKRFSLTLQSIGDAVITTDKKERVTMINPVASRITGYTPAEALGKDLKSIFNIVSYIDSTPMQSPVTEAIQSGEIVSLANHTDLISKNGARYHISDSAAPIKDANNDVIGAILVFRDVTKDYKKRDNLNMTMALLNQLSTQVNTSYFKVNVLTQDITPLIGNRLRFRPYRGNEPVDLREWIFADDYAMIMKGFEEIKSKKRNSISATIHTTFEGREQYFFIYASLVEASNAGKNSDEEMIGMMRDITLEKEQEHKCNQAISILENIENGIPFPIFVKDIGDNFRYLRCNKTFANRIGKDKKDIIGKTDFEIMPNPIDADQMRNHDRQVAQTGDAKSYSETFTDDKGNAYQVQSIKQVIQSMDGRMLLLGISIKDFSNSEPANAVNQNEAVLREALHSLPASIFIKDVYKDYSYIFWNRAMEKQTDLRAEDVLNKSDSQLDITIEDADKYRNQDEALANDKRETSDIISMFSKEQQKQLIYDVSKTLMTVNNKKYILGLCKDISQYTDLKVESDKMLEKVKQHSEAENVINECLTFMSFEDNLKNNIVKFLEIFSKAMKATRGYVYRLENDKLIKDFEWSANGVLSLQSYSLSEFGDWVKKFKKDEIVIIKSPISAPDDLMSSAEVLSAEMVKSSIAAGIKRNGNLYGLIGFDYLQEPCDFNNLHIQLINGAVNMHNLARKRSEQINLIEDEHRLQSIIFNNIGTPMIIVDKNRIIKAVNNVFFEAWDVEVKDVVGKKCNQFGACSKRETPYCTPNNCTLWKCILEGKQQTSTKEIGKKRMRLQATPVLDEHENVLYAVETIIDVTDIESQRKTLEQFLAQDQTIKECMEVLVMENDYNQAIKSVFSVLASKFTTFTLGLFKYHNLKKPYIQPIKILDAKDIKRTNFNEASYSISRFPLNLEVIKRTLKPRRISIQETRTSKIPADIEATSFMMELGITDIIIVPVLLNGNLWGYFSCVSTSTEHPISQTDERIFEGIANVFTILLEREHQKTIIESEANLHSQIFDSIEVPVAMLDSQKRIMAINKSCCNLLKISKSKALGTDCREIFCRASGTKSCSPDICPIWKTLETGKPATLDYQMDDKSIMHFQTQPIFDKNNKIAYAIESIIDITSERRQQSILKSQGQELEIFNNQLRIYVEQDKTIASCMDILALESDPQNAMNDVLQKVGPHLNADNCAVYKYISGQNARFNQLSLWTASEAVHQLGNMDLIYEKDFPNAFRQLRDGKIVHATLSDKNLNQTWRKEVFQYLTYSRESELILAPLMLKNEFWGYIGVERNEDCKTFGSEGMRMFENVSHIIEIILEREKHNLQLQSEQAEKQIILDLLPIPVVLFDDSMNILNANPAAKKMIGGNGNRIFANTTCLNYCGKCKDDEVSESCPVKNTILTGLPQVEERFIMEVPYLINTLPIFEGNKVVKVLQSMVDVSEMAKTKELLLKAAIDAKEASADKTAVILKSSGNIIPSLGQIADEIDRLRANDETIDKKESLENLSNSIKALLSMLNNVFESVQKAKSAREIQLSNTNMESLFKNLERDFIQEARDKGLSLSFSAQASLPDLLLEKELLQNILAKILSNAIKHTRTGAIKAYASYEESIMRNSAVLIIKIKDTGIGIPDDIKSKIFEEKQENRISAQYDLSLPSICKSIESMGGKIRVSSQIDMGTCFTITMPANLVNRQSPIAKQSGQIETVGNQGERILVVDDVSMNVKVLSAMLKKLGYQVRGAFSAKEAYKVLDDFIPDWILTDIWMPEINGVDFARSLRNRPDMNQTHIIAVTADAESENNFDTSCFENILLKPVTADILKKTLSVKDKE